MEVHRDSDEMNLVRMMCECVYKYVHVLMHAHVPAYVRWEGEVNNV